MSPRQMQYLSMIQHHWILALAPPTLSDVARAMNITRGGAQSMITRLKLHGYLINDKHIIPSNIRISFEGDYE